MNKRIKTGINVHSNCFLIRWSRTENHHHLPMWSQFFFLNWFLTNQRWNDLVLCGKTLWTISFKSHLAWNECHDHIQHSQRIFFLASQKTKRSCFNWEEMEKTNRKSNHIKKISSLCPIKKIKKLLLLLFEFFTPFIQIKWLYNICSTTCLAAPFKEALNQKGVFLTFYTMWCAGGWFPSFKCDEYFMTTGNCQAVWRLDGWGWRKKKFLIAGENMLLLSFTQYMVRLLLPQSMYTSIYVCATQKRGNFYGLVMATLPQLRRRESRV